MPIAEPQTTPAPVSRAQARLLFESLKNLSALVIAVSGGPDSMALLFLLARWRAARKNGPVLIAATVDHGLRREAAAEARMVKAYARAHGIVHHTLRWRGEKPRTGLQEAARLARYRLLSACARRHGATHVLTAHTSDDQAETVLMRLCRGSGLSGLGGMADLGGGPAEVAPAVLLRPLLGVPKACLVATVEREGVPFVRDPSNDEPRFTRVRLRALMTTLAPEGLDAARLGLLARRVRRAETALEAATDAAAALQTEANGRFLVPLTEFCALPAEIGLRLLGRLIRAAGDKGSVELGKLEALYEAVRQARPLRQTLAGALVGVRAPHLTVERAPSRRVPAARKGRL